MFVPIAEDFSFLNFEYQLISPSESLERRASDKLF